MSTQPERVEGLSGICSECKEEFPLGGSEQQQLLADQALPCPKCSAMQAVRKADVEKLKPGGGDVRHAAMVVMVIVSLCNLAFWASVWSDGVRSDTAHLGAVVISTAAQLAASWGVRWADRYFTVRLISNNSSGDK